MTFKEKTLSQLAGGFSIYSEKAGIGGLSNLQTNISLAYFLPLNAKQFISVGFQGGLVQKKIENADLLFPNQYNGSAYNKNISSGENFTTFYYVYPDLSCGLLWGFQKQDKRIPSNGITKMNLGFSVYHLTQPRESFLNTHPNSLMRFNSHGELNYLASNANVGISPSFNLSLQGSSMLLMIGNYINYYFNENSKYTGINKRSSLNFGTFYKYQNDIAFNFIYERADQYALGFSYDIGLSKINMVSQSRGGFEILLRYTPPMAFLYEKKQAK